MSPDTLQTLLDASQNRTSLVRAVRLKDGTEWLIDPVLQQFPDPNLTATAQLCLAHEETRLAKIGEDTYLITPHLPPKRLILIGAVHIARALSPMAANAGFSVTVIDPRGAFMTSAPIADATLLEDWPDEILQTQKPDASTALVTLTHDPKLDEAALVEALRSQAFYIGCLGSRKTHAARLSRLRDKGFGDADLARLHGPVGLDIKAANPAEIAVSILAQIIQVRRGGKQ